MNKRSEKVKAEASAFAAVYRQVDQRSEGRCEVTTTAGAVAALDRGEFTRPRDITARCPRRGVEHHHLFKPRRSNHDASKVVLVCRVCHDRMEYPFIRGRLCFVGMCGATFLFSLRYASDKFTARANG